MLDLQQIKKEYSEPLQGYVGQLIQGILGTGGDGLITVG